MSVTMPRIMLLAGLLSLSSLWSNSSWALGLGEIHLNSALNEPMNAEIDLIAATPDELTALRATLAPRDAFTRYGIDRPPFLSTLTFKVAKSKDGRDVLQVRSTDAIPEPFVTFLVEVNWARGRLMREYTVLLDPPVYTPGENAGSSAPVTAPVTAPSAAASTTAVPPPPSVAAPTATQATAPVTGRRSRSRRAPAVAPPADTGPVTTAPATEAPTPPPTEASAPSGSAPSTVQVAKGDTLTKIARSLHADTPADVDQTMIALYRANPAAFGGNINVLREGRVLRVPGADEIAALNQKEAMSEVHRQMDAWRGSGSAPSEPSGHLRLVTPSAGGGAGSTSAGNGNASNAEDQALKDRVKDLEGQLAESKRLLDVRNDQLAELQRKLGASAASSTPPVTPPPSLTQKASPPPPPEQPKTAATPPPSMTATPPTTAVQPPPPSTTAAPPTTATPPEANNAAPVVTPPSPIKPPVNKPAAPPPAASGSVIDWLQDNWMVPVAGLLAILAVLGFAAWRKRKNSDSGSMNDLGSVLDETQITDMNDSAAKLTALRNKANDSFVVEESGQHPVPDMTAETGRFGDTGELRTSSPEDTMSSESAVNLDQGDPLAEADFHMAYGLYDQAADLVRIALEREPDRRDLRLKLLEIYFVWGNKDAFLQTAKELAATRARAPAGEWDKIVIMGKQICPDEPLFATSAGSGRGAGALVDLNLEGGENRVDIDLFGEPEGERSSLEQSHAKVNEDTAATGESPGLNSRSDLDFTLDTPERGADESPTREMPPRDEPTVEAELMNFADAPTTESPVLKTTDESGSNRRGIDRRSRAQPRSTRADGFAPRADRLAVGRPPCAARGNRSSLRRTDHGGRARRALSADDGGGSEECARPRFDRARARARGFVHRRSRSASAGRDQDRRAGPRVRPHGPDAARRRGVRHHARQIARVLRHPRSGQGRHRFHLEAARHQRGQHRSGSRPVGDGVGQRRYGGTAARRGGSVLHRGVRGQPAQPARRSRRGRGDERLRASDQ
jgi:pilus assembly protein FimV